MQIDSVVGTCIVEIYYSLAYILRRTETGEGKLIPFAACLKEGNVM